MSDIEIKHITVKIGEVELDMTIAQAKELQKKLNELLKADAPETFGNLREVIDRYWPGKQQPLTPLIPNQPLAPFPTPWPYDPFKVIC